MSIFKALFSNIPKTKNQSHHSFWHDLASEKDLQEAKALSFSTTVYLFKHSTRCHISKTVLSNFEKQVEKQPVEASFFLLDLLSHRALSNKISEEFLVTHQSPQLLVLKNGKVIKHASHHMISLD